eukprot:m.78287 g.78287  ORF g.78287 m.78287 type:complete len:426 (+) comp9205_c0_seq2:1562-2839(+)
MQCWDVHGWIGVMSKDRAKARGVVYKGKCAMRLPIASLGPVNGRPPQKRRVDANLSFGHGFLVRLDDFWGDTETVLTLVVLDEAQVLHRRDDVLMGHGRGCGNVTNGYGFLPLQDHLQHRLAPVAPVAQQAQVRQRLLGRSEFAFNLADFVGEFNQQFAVPFALVRREGEDTGHVVVLRRVLLLAKVAHQVAALLVHLRHNIKQKGVRVVVQRLVVEKQLGNEAEVLRVVLVFATIQFKKDNRVFAVDFITRGVSECALALVVLKRRFGAVVLEAKFADSDEWFRGEAFWVGREVPWLDVVLTKLNHFNVAHSCDDIVHSVLTHTTFSFSFLFLLITSFNGCRCRCRCCSITTLGGLGCELPFAFVLFTAPLLRFCRGALKLLFLLLRRLDLVKVNAVRIHPFIQALVPLDIVHIEPFCRRLAFG